MTGSKMRTLELIGTKRTGIRLDSATWQAIDWIAAQQGRKWSDWARDALQNNPSTDNMTAVIREAAMKSLMAETIFAERGQDIDAMDANSFTQRSALFNDRQLDDFLNHATIQGKSDFIAFSVIFGQDESGTDFLVVKNSMRNGLHFATLALEISR